MVMYRFDFKARTRNDAQGGADLVRYLRREGEFAPKVVRDADVDYMTRQSMDTAAHADLVGEPLVGNLPAWAEDSASTYFAGAREYETRPGAQYAIALQIALPRELTHEQHMALAQDFIDATLHDKPYLLVKHEPVTDGVGQPHLHILVGPRKEDGIARSPAQHFARYNPGHPELGGAQKDRFWNQRQAPRLLRVAFADLANYHLERAGVAVRIDPRSLRGQGIERERISWASKVYVDEATRQREQAKATATWEQRKVYRGLANVHDIPREEMVLLVRQWTRQYERGQQLPRVSTAEVIAWEEKERQRVTQEREALERHLSEIERAQRGELRAHELLALLRRGDEPVRQGLRARLFEDEQPGYRY